MHGLTLAEIAVEEGVSGSFLSRNGRSAARCSPSSTRRYRHRGQARSPVRSALDALKVVESLKARGVKLHLLDLGGDIAGNGLSKLS